MRGLTLELSGRQRQDARPGLAKMYRVLTAGRWWYAVGAPLERGVRRRALNEATGERGVQKVPSKMHVTTHSARINPAPAVERR